MKGTEIQCRSLLLPPSPGKEMGFARFRRDDTAWHAPPFPRICSSSDVGLRQRGREVDVVCRDEAPRIPLAAALSMEAFRERPQNAGWVPSPSNTPPTCRAKPALCIGEEHSTEYGSVRRGLRGTNVSKCGRWATVLSAEPHPRRRIANLVIC